MAGGITFASLALVLPKLLVTAAVAAIVLRHLRHGVLALSVQGLALAALAATFDRGGLGLVSVALVLAAKGIAVPWLLWRTAAARRAFETSEGVSAWVYPGILAVLVVVRTLDPTFDPNGGGALATALVPAGLAITLLGLVAVATRSLLPSQMLGLAVAENGVYATGLALTRGLPLALDLAIVLDLFLALFLLAWLTGRVQSAWGHIDAEQLDRLRG
jgi:hydrogenase-4 component E